jgi:hypothetical protein
VYFDHPKYFLVKDKKDGQIRFVGLGFRFSKDKG